LKERAGAAQNYLSNRNCFSRGKMIKIDSLLGRLSDGLKLARGIPADHRCQVPYDYSGL
jgi:hypothetical protein